MVVLLERVEEHLPVRVHRRGEPVALGQQIEWIAVEAGHHRPQELAQALTRLRVEVDEDEPLPALALDGDQAEVVLVEVEVLLLLEDEVQGAIEAVTPAVVLAHELPTGAAGRLSRRVIPQDLVPAVPAHVVKCTHLPVQVTHDDHRRSGDHDVLREEAAVARQLFDASDVEPRRVRRSPRARARRTRVRSNLRRKRGRSPALGSAPSNCLRRA